MGAVEPLHPIHVIGHMVIANGFCEYWHVSHHQIHILVLIQLVYFASDAGEMVAVRDVHSRGVEIMEKMLGFSLYVNQGYLWVWNSVESLCLHLQIVGQDTFGIRVEQGDVQLCSPLNLYTTPRSNMNANGRVHGAPQKCSWLLSGGPVISVGRVCMNWLRGVTGSLFRLPPVIVERAQGIMSPGAVEDVWGYLAHGGEVILTKNAPSHALPCTR